MISQTHIEVFISNNNIRHYTNLGYKNFISGNYYMVRTSDLPKGSGLIISVQCDICNASKNITYRKYLKNINNFNTYCCSRKCAQFKIENTYLKKYGVKSNFQVSEIKNKQKQTKFEKYGNENYNNPKKTKQTNIDKYGVTCPLLNSEIKEKTILTNINKYGFEHHLQNNERFIQHQKNSKKLKLHEQTGLRFQGTYEKDFLDFCCLNKIKVYKPESISYQFNNKKKIYFPDFYISSLNLIVEIKSDYYYNKFKEINLTKQKACIEQGHNFLFIINKDYSQLKAFL